MALQTLILRPTNRGWHIRPARMLSSLVHDLLIILAAGLVAGVGWRSLRVSVLVGYLVVGALVGKGCIGWGHDGRHEIG